MYIPIQCRQREFTYANWIMTDRVEVREQFVKVPSPSFEPSERWRIMRNILAIGCAFMVLFTAFMGAANLQSSINADQSLGTFTLSAIYGSLLFSNIFLPALVIRWDSREGNLSLAYIAVLFLYVSFVLILNNGSICQKSALGVTWRDNGARQYIFADYRDWRDKYFAPHSARRTGCRQIWLRPRVVCSRGKNENIQLFAKISSGGRRGLDRRVNAWRKARCFFSPYTREKNTSRVIDLVQFQTRKLYYALPFSPWRGIISHQTPAGFSDNRERNERVRALVRRFKMTIF